MAEEKKKIGTVAIAQLGLILVGVAADIQKKTKEKSFKWNVDLQDYLNGVSGSLIQSDIMSNSAEQGMLFGVEIVTQLLKIYTGIEKDGFGFEDLKTISVAAEQIISKIPKKEVPAV